MDRVEIGSAVTSAFDGDETDFETLLGLFELLAEGIQGRFGESQLVACPENVEITLRDPQHQLLAGEGELGVGALGSQICLLELNPQIAVINGLSDADVGLLVTPVGGTGSRGRSLYVGVVMANGAAGA